MTPRQGDIWWVESEDRRRPVLVVTRNQAIGVLNRIVVAPISTPCVASRPKSHGLEHGLATACAASFDNLQPIRRAFLTQRVGSLGVTSTSEICRALEALADC